MCLDIAWDQGSYVAFDNILRWSYSRFCSLLECSEISDIQAQK